MTRAYKLWTDAEDEQLRQAWASEKLLKEFASEFPGRSVPSLVARMSALGISRRPEGFKRPVRSNIWVLIEKMLRDGEHLTTREITNRLGCTYRHAWQLLDEKFHADEPLIHIAHWKRARPGDAKSVWVEAWAYGEGPSPRKPKPPTRTEHVRLYRIRARSRAGLIESNPFAVAMSQIIQGSA